MGQIDAGLQHPQPTSLIKVLVAGMQTPRARSTSVSPCLIVVVVVVEAEDTREERSTTPVDVQLRLEVTHSPVDDQSCS